jgi:hypothetical protein
MMTETYEIGLGELLVRVRERHRGIEADARHALQGLVRDLHPGQLPVPRDRLRPGEPPPGVHRGGQLPRRRVPAFRDLLQRLVHHRHRRDLPEQLALVGEDPEIAEPPRTVRDRAGHVRQHPAPVMVNEPARRQRRRQAAGQSRLIRQVPQQPDPGMRHDPGTVPGYFQALRPRGNVHF